METSSSLSSEPPPDLNLPFFSGPPEIIAGIITVILLFLVSIFLYGAEAAFFSISPNDKLKLAKRGKISGKRALKILENPEKLMATLFSANRLVSDIVIILAAFITSGFVQISGSLVFELILLAVVFAFILMVTGKILPRLFLSRAGIRFAEFMAFPVSFTLTLLSPVVALLGLPSSFFAKKMAKYKMDNSVADLSQALEQHSELEISEEKGILEGIVKFNNIRVVEVMKPRGDVETIDIKTPFDEVINIITESGFSRIPVISDSFDRIQGILYIKDLLPHVNKGKNFKWQSTIRPPFYVPESKMIRSLLEDFRKRKFHMAIVVDEYGGSAGIVTLEDILEEIVGEINDESDVEEPFYSKISDNKYIFDGKTLLSDFYKAAGADDSAFEEVKGEADTLAGLILEIEGEIPALHSQISFNNYIFTIEAVNDRRIEQIKVEIQ